MTNTSETEHELYGLVLAGGKSSRMGFDKGSINYHGKPQSEYLFEVLSKFCSKVFFSCKPMANVKESLNPLPDLFNIETPLNGILSAFKMYPDVSWITVPIDMPLVKEDVIQFLIDNRNKNKIATCFYDSDGENPEPLLTLWENTACIKLKAYFEAGNISPRNFLKQNDIQLLHPPNRSIYQNINTPEALQDFLNQRKGYS